MCKSSFGCPDSLRGQGTQTVPKLPKQSDARETDLWSDTNSVPDLIIDVDSCACPYAVWDPVNSLEQFLNLPPANSLKERRLMQRESELCGFNIGKFLTEISSQKCPKLHYVLIIKMFSTYTEISINC